MEMKDIRIKFPENATLQEIIQILNFSHYTVNVEHPDPEFQKWLYDHKDWVMSEEE